MSTLSCIAFVAVGAVFGDTDDIAEAIRGMLALKGTAYPYSAEYELALPPQPRIAGGTEKRRVFAEKPDQLYSEETTESQRIRVLIRDKKLLFEYSDALSHSLCEGPVDLGGKSPERWLQDHDFMLNSCAPLDADLIEVIRGILSGAKVTGHDAAGALHTYHLSGSRLGDLVIVLGSTTVAISAVVPGTAPAKPRVVVRYIYRDGRAPWSAAALAELTADFKKAGEQGVHRLTGRFTMFSALKQSLPPTGIIRVISPPEIKQLASRHGYLLPSSPRAKVVEAKDFDGQLHLKIEFGPKTYSIGQYPAVSRVCDDELLAPCVRGRRKLGDFTVLDVDPAGTESNDIYYLKPGVALLVQDPEYKHIPFMNPNLDHLIESFAPSVTRKDGR